MKADTLLAPVMVVDDDDDDVILFTRHLKTAGVKNPIIRFREGNEAYVFLHRLCSSPTKAEKMPAVIFLDVNMNGLSGFDVLAWTRKQPALRHIKILVLSGANETWDAQIAAKLGADDYLEKFPEPAALRKLLAPVCVLQPDFGIRANPAESTS